MNGRNSPLRGSLRLRRLTGAAVRTQAEPEGAPVDLGGNTAKTHKQLKLHMKLKILFPFSRNRSTQADVWLPCCEVAAWCAFEGPPNHRGGGVVQSGFDEVRRSAGRKSRAADLTEASRFYDGPPDDYHPWIDGIRTDRSMDLFDALMLHWDEDERTIYVGLTTDSVQWKVWDDKTIGKIEILMHEDLTFDGDHVEITRVTGEGTTCGEQMVWRVVIRQSS